MERTHLATLDDDALAAAFNVVYEDYLVPVQITGPQIRQHVESNDVALDESPWWRGDAGVTVALGLLGRRDGRGWIGGFGVAKPERGRGHGKALASAMLGRARELGLGEVWLEVLTRNEGAIRTYVRAGFEITRDLLILVRPADAVASCVAHGVEEHEAVALLARAEGLATPCWQRAPRSLRDASGLVGLAVGPADAPDAMAAVRATPEGVRIVELRATRPEAVGPLVAGIVARHPQQSITIVNEPEESPLVAALLEAGFGERLRQHEMVVRLG